MLTSELGICPNWRSDDETNVDSNIGNFGDHEKWGVDHAKSGNLPIQTNGDLNDTAVNHLMIILDEILLRDETGRQSSMMVVCADDL